MSRRCAALMVALAALSTVTGAAAPPPLPVVDEPARAPYAVRRELVHLTVGPTVSLVESVVEFVYVRAFDSKDNLDPVLIDVPVFVAAENITPGSVLRSTRVRLAIGANAYQPREVLLLDHTIIDPVPDVPDGVRIAIVSFNIPRQALKPKFKAQITYDQPHIRGDDGEALAAYLPVLPDFLQMRDVLHFKPDDLVVKFTAVPEVQLALHSVNAEVVLDSPNEVTVRPRHRETIAVTVESVSTAPAVER